MLGKVCAMIVIKQKVKQCRIERGISKAHLARRVGVTRSYITRLENEELQPSGPAMLRFARYFGRPVEEIFQLPEEAIKT